METGHLHKQNEPRAPLWVFGLVVAVQFMLDPFFVLVVFRHGWLAPLHRITNGFVTGTVIAYWVMLPLVVGGMIFHLGGLRPGDVGLRKRNIKTAALFTLLLWAVVAAVECLGQVGHFVVDPAWSKPGPVALAGMLFSQVFGNALYEEIVFRGFLTLQLFRWRGRMGRWKSLVFAIIGAQLVFASIHIPVLMLNGANAMQILETLPVLFVLGVGLAVLFLVTDNLLIAVGVHALVDWPYLVGHDVSGLGDNFSIVYLVLALAVACFWRLGFPHRSSSTVY